MVRHERRQDTWGLAAIEATSFFVGIMAGIWAPVALGTPGPAIPAALAVIAWWRRFQMFAAGLLIGIGLLLAMAAWLDFARPDF